MKNNNKYNKLLLKGLVAVLLVMFTSGNLYSQCKIENNYFQSGEVLNYDLYFKIGPFTKKSGKARMSVVNTNYQGQDAFKISLASSSEGLARDLFAMDDTISCVISKNLVPLAFNKDAHEDGDYTRERLTYSYSGNNATIRSIRHKNGNFKFDKTFQTTNCTYDMLSVVFYARTLNYSSMKKGDKKRVDFVSAKKQMYMEIIHDGTENLKANDGKKYKCIKLQLKITDDAFENEENAMTVYLTNDQNRMPVRIDSKLKVGNARVILKNYKGNKHSVGIAN